VAPGSDLARQSEATGAFPVASRGGDFDALLARNLSRTTTTEVASAHR